MLVNLRPLVESDAKISYVWRNDVELWKLTGSKPNKTITHEIEKQWIKDVLSRENESRFAICIGIQNEYVGNVQLTNITDIDAEFHIFIGEKKLHNQGIGSKATALILKFGFEHLKLKNIYLFVNNKNTAALKSYLKCGFVEVSNKQNEIKLNINSNL